MEIRGSHNFLKRPQFNGSGLALKDRVVTNADFINTSGDLQSQITSNNTDITTLQYASGNLDTRVLANNTNIIALQAVSGVGAHNDLTEIQGGTATEYYHLTSGEHAGLTDVVIQAATSGVYDVDWSLAGLTRITLDGNITFTFSSPYDGQKHIVQIKQDATGSHLATWPATVRWPASTAPTLTATSGGIDYIGFIYDGSDSKYDGLANSLELQ